MGIKLTKETKTENCIKVMVQGINQDHLLKAESQLKLAIVEKLNNKC